MFGNHGLCGLLEEGAHGKSPKCLGGNLGDFGEFCKGLFLCEPYLKSGQLVRLFPEVEIQKWQLFLYRSYETVTPLMVLKVFEILEGILKKEFER
ncbi:hypothetical protein NEIPOLOT_01624 [Neisseria polysaccharea ATCC 43768]|uniref:hypothetical protein n=1 Tax=Neisseria polysaccharea TaxID=489 RepID=UPI0001D9D745|nr:hypothetical protein NEIPOLOT_01624 [Neisseria polysaccharea ATCC 43768]